MSKIKAIIVDDEKDARESLELCITEFYPNEVEIVSSVSSVNEAVKSINKLKPDLVFLDIEMPNENGFQLFEYFNKELDFDVVFITAYDQYATRAFRYAALDYLLKPFDYRELGETIKRYSHKNNNMTNVKISTFFNNLNNDLEINKKVIFPSRNGYHIEKISNILFIKSDVNYSIINTIDKQTFTIASTLKKLEETLSSSVFFRIHKSYLVNLNYIKRFDRKRNKIILENSIELDIAIRRVDSFLNALKSNPL